MTGDGKEMATSGKILFDHEQRIGKTEGEIELIKVKMLNFEQIAQLMVSSVDELKKTVIDGHTEQMRFLQDVVKHDQGLENIKTQFDHEMEKMKVEQTTAAAATERQREEFEREQRTENKKMTWKAIRQFALWFAPTVTVVVTLINEWLQGV